MATISPKTNQTISDLPNTRIHSNKVKEASHGGHGIVQIKQVIGELSAAAIPSCIVGVRALRYHGAIGRVADDWDICIPDDKLSVAYELFTGHTSPKFDIVKETETGNDRNLMLNTEPNPPSYELIPPTSHSSRQQHPRFKLKDYNFYFNLRPLSSFLPTFTFDSPTAQPPAVDDESNKLESSKENTPPTIEPSPQNKIPYPTRTQLAGALLIQGNWSDLDDFIDGTNVDVQWGLDNLDFETLADLSRAWKQQQLDQGLESGGGVGAFKTVTAEELEERWRREASREEKDRRMGSDKKGRWLTRWMRMPNADGSARRSKKLEETV